MPVPIRELVVSSADISGLKYSATCMENQSTARQCFLYYASQSGGSGRREDIRAFVSCPFTGSPASISSSTSENETSISPSDPFAQAVIGSQCL